MTKQSSGPLGEELRSLLRLIEEVPTREPEPPREATVIPARTFERHRQKDDANRRPIGERPVPPVPPVPPARERLMTRAVSIAAVGLAGALAVWAWFVLGPRTSPNALAGSAKATREPTTAIAQLGPPLRSATAPATHTPTPMPMPSTTVPPETPDLTVQPVTAASNERVRFPVRIEPMSFADGTFIRVQGLPKGTTLTRGRFVPPDSWIVPAGDFAALELTLGDVAAGRFDLAAELHTENGRSLAQAKSTLVVTKRPAERTAAAVGSEIARPSGPSFFRDSGLSSSSMFNLSDAPDQGQEKFLAQGLRLLLSGSVNSARLLLQRAAEAGDAHAALILGDTYDEVRLSQIGALGVLPDRDKANFWYGRADELGASEAKDRLSEINSR